MYHLYLFFLADWNSLDATFAKRTCYSFFTAERMKFYIEDFFSKCDQIHRKLQFLCNVCLLKSMVKKLFKFNTTAAKQTSFIHLIIALM